MTENKSMTEILRDPQTWVLYQELATSSLSPQLATEALEIGGRFLMAATNATFIDPLPAWVQGLFLTVMQHVAYGTPMCFSDSIAAEWGAFTGAVSQCPTDGYRAPSSIETCPVCGAGMIRVAQSVPLGVTAAVTLTNIPVA